jgi:1-acyl-sn-glycerol-3-phosphate acyltransferase
MKIVKAIFAYAWKIYFLLVVMLVILILYPIQLVLLSNEKYFQKGFTLIRFQANAILFLIGVRKEIHGNIPNDSKTSYIICPNHSSYLDILLLYAAFPNYFIFLGKKELGSVPIFNIYFKKMNLLVDRANPKAAHKAIANACEKLRNGTNLVIFPEGTIPTTTPQMKAFKNGAFYAAAETNTAIIPITFKDNYKLLEDNWSFFSKTGPGKSRVYIHPPIFPKNGDVDLLTLRDETRLAIESRLD